MSGLEILQCLALLFQVDVPEVGYERKNRPTFAEVF
jgi:hypothetical protein